MNGSRAESATGTGVPRVGIIGGGQLARMIAQEAVSLGVRVSVLAGASDEGVPGVFASVTTGSPDDAEAIDAFGGGVDVVTFDHENVDWAALDALEARGIAVRPGPGTLRFADKAHQRERLARAGCPVPPFEIVDPVGEAAASGGAGAQGAEPPGGADDDPPVIEVARRFAQAHGPEIIAKASRGGYDGRAVFPLDGADAVAEFVAAWTGAPLVLEPKLDLAAEVAVLTARRPNGEHVTYPVLETIQRDGMCNEVVVPARLDDSVLERARQVGAEVALVTEAVGVVAVELFITTDGVVLVNELAPRVHNSGHLTMDACVTGQFEQHLRAVLDLPLGDVSLRTPAAAMVNVVGAREGADVQHGDTGDEVVGGDEQFEPRARLGDGMSVDPAAKIHLYAKTPKPDRKIGHVTVCDDDVDRALTRATAVARALDGRNKP